MTIRCPACRAGGITRALRHFEAGDAAQHFVLREEFPQVHAELVQHIRSLWGGEGCDLHACSACGLQFAWPFVAGDGRFYNLAYPYSSYPSERWEFEQSLQALARTPLPPGPVLEIGSGSGQFLRKLSPRFVAPHDVLSIEFNDTARQQLQAMGFQTFAADVRSDAFANLRGSLQAVFMFQVLEHLDGLDALTERLDTLLAPGASVHVAVPNIERIDHAEAHGGLLDMPPNHISRWTEGAFRALAARAGWTLCDWRVEPAGWRNFVKIDLINSHMRRAQRSGSLANLARGRRRTPARVAVEGVLALAAAPARLPGWIKAAPKRRSLGDSVWLRLRKPGATGA